MTPREQQARGAPETASIVELYAQKHWLCARINMTFIPATQRRKLNCYMT